MRSIENMRQLQSQRAKEYCVELRRSNIVATQYSHAIISKNVKFDVFDEKTRKIETRYSVVRSCELTAQSNNLSFNERASYRIFHVKRKNANYYTVTSSHDETKITTEKSLAKHYSHYTERVSQSDFCKASKAKREYRSTEQVKQIERMSYEQLEKFLSSRVSVNALTEILNKL